MLETNLHALINPGAPGIPEYGKADINVKLNANNSGHVLHQWCLLRASNCAGAATNIERSTKRPGYDAKWERYHVRAKQRRGVNMPRLPPEGG